MFRNQISHCKHFKMMITLLSSRLLLRFFVFIVLVVASPGGGVLVRAQEVQEQGSNAFNATLPPSFNTTEDAVEYASYFAKMSVNYAGGNYGNSDLMNFIIQNLNETQSSLASACRVIGDDENCQQNVTEPLVAAADKVLLMRDLDLENDIIVLFGQYWRPNACLGGRSFGAPAYGNDQCWSVERNYSIHGIWPSSSNVRAFPNPTNCSAPSDLALDDIPSSLQGELNQRWISYYPIWNNTEFWQWEWYKHGSCWDRTKEEFLRQAVEWHDLHNIPAILEANNIPLGELVKTTVLLETLSQNMWGEKMGLLCIDEGMHVDQFFACFNYAGTTPVDCPPASQCNDEVLLRVYDATDVPTTNQSTSAATASNGAELAVLFMMLLSFSL